MTNEDGPAKGMHEFREEFEEVKDEITEACKVAAEIIPEFKEAIKPVADALTEIVTEAGVESLQDERIPMAVATHHLTYIKEMCEGLKEMGATREERLQLIAAGLTRR